LGKGQHCTVICSSCPLPEQPLSPRSLCVLCAYAVNNWFHFADLSQAVDITCNHFVTNGVNRVKSAAVAKMDRWHYPQVTVENLVTS
jgi:hypothetical protein